MKAAVYSKYGPPEVIKLTNLSIPEPKDQEVQIKIYATTVNRTDCGFRSAEYFIVRFFSGLIYPKNKTLGNEFSGVVESIGKEVKKFKVGDKVFGYNDLKFGAHAEYLVIHEDAAVLQMPEKLSFIEAAAITEGAHYALCDIRAAKIVAKQDVLINGATGGIGSAAVQIAKYLGAKVTAVCHAKNVELVKSLGADTVIALETEDFTKRLQTYDVVFDAVGKSSFGKCKPILKKQGIYMSTELGYLSQNPFLALLGLFYKGKKVLFPIPTISKDDLVFFKKLIDEGKFKPVIDRTYLLENIVDAYHYVESGQKIGNVVIEVVKSKD